MKAVTKLLGGWLPLMAAASVVAWLVIGVLPGVKLTDDLIAWLLELPVVTCYALAAGGATVLTMNIIGADIDNARRCELMRLAQEGNEAARRALREEWIQWIVVLVANLLFFYPHR